MSDLHDGDRLAGRDLDVLEELGYEPTDEAVSGPVGKYTAMFFVFLAIMLGIAWLFFTFADRVDGFKFNQERPARVMPPDGTPLLQGNVAAQADMEDLRKEEHEKLEAYKENPETGRYQIPVEKAMSIVVERGLPTRANAGAPEDSK